MMEHDHTAKEKHDNTSARLGSNHHARMVADFRKRFWISLTLTLPILVLSPMLQRLVGLPAGTSFAVHVSIN
jgi:Cu2+-exporting ATPase